MATDLGISIDRLSGAPASAQLTAALRRGVDAGDLTPGDRLPTVRALASRLGLAPNTVARAYRELVAAGYLVARGRSGTFVADGPPEPAAPPDPEVLAAAYLARSRAAGVSDIEAVRAVRRLTRDRRDHGTRS